MPPSVSSPRPLSAASGSSTIPRTRLDSITSAAITSGSEPQSPLLSPVSALLQPKPGVPYAALSSWSAGEIHEPSACLELQDGTVFRGWSYGAPKSAAGELVFQTGMVGYPESLTDPSYRGQILVMTFPLAGNYGVPSRQDMDRLLGDLPAYFEASEIHVAALVTASYSGEDFSHFLAESSLGSWLKEQGVPAIHGLDTRALTKRIREEGSMLGRLLQTKPSTPVNGVNGVSTHQSISRDSPTGWRSEFEMIDWVDPNKRNLVAEGKID